MPTNLYGSGDNFNLETSHVLPALIRKMHLTQCLENNDLDSIRKDINKRPIRGIDGTASNEDIVSVLNSFGIRYSKLAVGIMQSANSQNDVPTANRPLPTVLSLWGSGKPRREFLYVDDLADAVVFLMNNYNAKDIGEFINIGTGNDLTIKELAEMIKNIVGFKGSIDWDSSKPDGTPQKLLNIDRLHKLGWKAQIPLKGGIKKDYQWYKNRRI